MPRVRGLLVFNVGPHLRYFAAMTECSKAAECQDLTQGLISGDPRGLCTIYETLGAVLDLDGKVEEESWGPVKIVDEQRGLGCVHDLLVSLHETPSIISSSVTSSMITSRVEVTLLTLLIPTSVAFLGRLPCGFPILHQARCRLRLRPLGSNKYARFVPCSECLIIYDDDLCASAMSTQQPVGANKIRCACYDSRNIDDGITATSSAQH